jgi:hypothetical protein
MASDSLYEITKRGDLETIKKITENFGSFSTWTSGVAICAVKYGHVHIIKYITSLGWYPKNFNCLYAAIKNKNIEMVKFFTKATYISQTLNAALMLSIIENFFEAFKHLYHLICSDCGSGYLLDANSMGLLVVRTENMDFLKFFIENFLHKNAELLTKLSHISLACGSIQSTEYLSSRLQNDDGQTNVRPSEKMDESICDDNVVLLLAPKSTRIDPCVYLISSLKIGETAFASNDVLLSYGDAELTYIIDTITKFKFIADPKTKLKIEGFELTASKIKQQLDQNVLNLRSQKIRSFIDIFKSLASTNKFVFDGYLDELHFPTLALCNGATLKKLVTDESDTRGQKRPAPSNEEINMEAPAAKKTF